MYKNVRISVIHNDLTVEEVDAIGLILKILIK